MSVLDVFKSNAFSLTTLTDAINKLPFIPGRAGKVIDWNEQGIATTVAFVEEYGGSLTLINPIGRGGPGISVAKNKRTAHPLTMPHYQVDDALYAEEIQGIRAFGQESQAQTIQEMVSMRMGEHVQLRLDPTLEYQRVGAVKGIILNGDGTTLYNLFTEFNIAQPTEVAFDLTNGSPASGAVRRGATGVVRSIAVALGGVPFDHIHAFCSDTFWDDLIANVEVRSTYLNQEAAAQLREGVAYGLLSYGGIIFENYRGAVGAVPFMAADKAYFFPVGVPGLFRTVYAPADYVETVNTIGLPRYSRQFPMENGKGINIEAQMNPLSYCTRPGTLVQGRRGA